MPLLEFLLTELDIHFSCIVISETWFSSNTLLNQYKIAGYNLYCSSRPDGGGGGICVYVTDSLEVGSDGRTVGGSGICVGSYFLWGALSLHYASDIPDAFLNNLSAAL